MRTRLAAALPVLLALACGGDAADPPALVVGDVAFTEAELGALSAGQRAQLAELTAFGLATIGGRLDDVMHPYIDRERRSALLRLLAAEVAVEQAGVTEAELERLYLEDPEWVLTVRHLIRLAGPHDPAADRQAARAAAEAALARVEGGESFADVAAETSEEPGAAQRGGLLQPGIRGTWVDEFWEAAAALDSGEVSGVVETEYGFHVLKLEDREPVPFADARSRVLGRLVDARGVASRAEAWADSMAGTVEPDPIAISEAQAGAARRDAELVRWPGGSLTAGELNVAFAAFDRADRERLVDADATAFGRVVLGIARNERLAEAARERGLAVDSATLAGIRGDQVRRAEGWAQALGFRSGQTPGDVKLAALAALAESRQSAAIAREAVADLGPALRRRYPIRMPAADTADGAP